jgi:hypothetical protein
LVLSGQTAALNFSVQASDLLIANFIAGYAVTVALRHKKKAKPDLERLENVDEVWAMCFRDPPPELSAEVGDGVR